MRGKDEDRHIELSDELDVLPDVSADDTDLGWEPAYVRVSGEHADLQRLLDERPPHWD